MRRPLLGFAAFALTSLLVTTLVWNTLARSVPGPTVDYTAVFGDALGLRVGDDVRMAGVRVGRVESIDLHRDPAARDYRAIVGFIVQRDQTLYTDTKALIRYQNLLGQRYLALAPGRAPAPEPLSPGGRIPIERTEPSFDISVLLNGFQPLFRTLSVEQVDSLTGTLVQALQGDRMSLGAFITQAAALAGDWQRRDLVLTQVIVGLSTVTHRLAQRGDELETLVAQTRTLIDGLRDQGSALDAATTRIATTTETLTRMIAHTQPGLVPAQNSTTRALTLLLAEGERLDRLAVDFPAYLGNFGEAFSEGTWANAYLCSLDISLYDLVLPRGVVASVGGNSHSAVCR
ncbi:MCE family protein [Nocardia takedensis]|uniref:MCE family protein n=1 Tax=Nocardia takedensis TaxID=259390 RepID=UPI0002F4AD5C|nr:MCE family protein [Nocardia takedensis]